MSTSSQVPPQYAPLPRKVRRPLPTTILWRWRYELTLFLMISMGGLFAYRAAGLATTLLITAVIVAVGSAIPPLRRSVRRRVLWMATPHRVRAGLAHAWVHNRDGRLPAVLRTKQTGYGQAVTLWCPAGVCEQHVQAAAEIIRSACWARHVQVTAHPRYRHLVTVQIVREP